MIVMVTVTCIWPYLVIVPLLVSTYFILVTVLGMKLLSQAPTNECLDLVYFSVILK